jgi:hypothetical protein
MSTGEQLRQVRLEAHEGVGGWHVAITLTAHDSEGTPGEPFVLRTHTLMPSVDDELDQAWVVLICGAHMLEDAGSVGRVSGMSSRPVH